MDEYLNKLNPQQREAVIYTDGPSLVIAGAGSGKTRVLTYKIVYLLEHGFQPNRILALTFTNKAAREMKERIATLIDTGKSAQLWMGTFHSVFSKILRINAERIGFKHDFTIYDTNDSRSLIKMIIKDMQLDDKLYKYSVVQSHISNMKNALISPADYEHDIELRHADNRAQRPMMWALYKTYWNRCFVAGAMDFDDLLFYTNILFRDNPDILQKYQEYFQYVLVDEYQDTNFAQHLIISQICKKRQCLCVVGDDAQSIYSFRGANISNILTLKNTYPALQTFKLEENYRSTKNIIGAANSLIEKNKRQIQKHIFSNNAVGNKISVIQSYSDYEEGYLVASRIISIKANQGGTYEDFAILYRTNAQSRVLEEALRKRNIPYRIYGGLSFYQRKEIKDAISYFRLSINPNDDEALRRIINYPARGIGETTLRKIEQSALHHNVSLWQVINSPQQYQLSVNAGTQKKIEDFAGIINHFINGNAQGDNAYVLAQTILKESRLLASIANDNTPENISKQENLSELMNGINDFVETRTEEGAESQDLMLTNFLAEVSLATDQDTDIEDGTGECVTLMTVHAAKGLEFKNVIIVGVEEDLFPSSMSCDTLAGIEEERRLLYVAITRAKVDCTLTFATSRYKNGQTKGCSMSRFIRDIDSSFLSLSQTSATIADDSQSRATFQQRANHNAERQDSATSIIQRPISVAKAETPSGDFATHHVSELKVGIRIRHSRFGEGKILRIDCNGADPKISADFGPVGVKLLLLKFAKFSIIEENE